MSVIQPFEAEVIEGEILKGDLDSISTDEFDRLVKDHLANGQTRIIIDCRWLGFLSSLAIGSLVVLQTRLRRKGGSVKLAAIQGPVMKVLRTVRLDALLDIYGDLEFARQAFIDEAAGRPTKRTAIV
jgi:anti-sigma B factor antagonist